VEGESDITSTRGQALHFLFWDWTELHSQRVVVTAPDFQDNQTHRRLHRPPPHEDESPFLKV